MRPNKVLVTESQNTERGAKAPRFRILCQDLCLTRGDVPVISGLTADITFPRLLLVKGPVGAGKTTFLKILARILLPDSGTAAVTADDEAARLMYLHANPEFNFVTGNVADELLFASLDPARFADYKDRSVFDLSGGEMKKLSVHMGLAGDADIVVCDEPFDMLDDAERDMMRDTIIDASKSSGFIVATHDSVLDDAADAIITIEAAE